MPFNVKHGGAWKSASPHVKHQGVWKQATAYVKTGGVWKPLNNPTVSISPDYITRSGSTSSYTFPQQAASSSFGTPTAYSWGIVSSSGGTFALLGPQGASTASFEVSDAQAFASATVYCDVTVFGKVHRALASLEYSYTQPL